MLKDRLKEPLPLEAESTCLPSVCALVVKCPHATTFSGHTRKSDN